MIGECQMMVMTKKLKLSSKLKYDDSHLKLGEEVTIMKVLVRKYQT